VADTSPLIDVCVWLEIDQCRSVQLVIWGNPGSVPEPHVPSKSDAEDGFDVEPEDEPDEEDAPAPDPEPAADDEPMSVPPDEAELGLGAVGSKSSVLFWKLQPLATIALSRRNQKDPLFIRVPYSLVRARTILVGATVWIVRKIREKARVVSNSAGFWPAGFRGVTVRL
jgi:hypothetical protein